MLKVIGRRLALSVPLLFVVSALIFALESLIPGDAARTILGENATPDAVAHLRQQLGLNQAWTTRYGDWLSAAIHGDLGASLFTGESVTSSLNTRLAVTASLVLLTLLLSTAVGVSLGMAAAVRGGRLGRVIDVASLGGLALPNFWVAIVLASVFAVKLRLLPATGYTGLAEDPARWIESLVLSVCALSLFGTTILAKQTRDAVLQVLERDYVRMLRANGLSETRLLLKHVLRNAAIPVVTVAGLVAIGSLMGTVFVEQVFVLPGLGTLATQSTLDHDLPVILGIGVYFTLIVILVNLMVDVAYSMLNPKVRAR